MAQTRRGCGCLLAALLVLGAAAGLVFYKFFWPAIEERRREAPPPASGDELRVHVLDVGQGDSILIVAPGGKVVLVDASNPGQGKKILAKMQQYGAGQVDLLVATHAHADHIGAADEVMNATSVKTVLDSRVPNTTKNYQDFLAAVEGKVVAAGGQYVGAEPGQSFELGGGARLVVLAPIQPLFTREDVRAGGNEPNANSVVLRLDYGDFSMLLTGDAEAQTEDRMMQKGANVAADVLKVGHHGSKYATSEEFLRRGEFKAAVVSCGADNRYGHPSQEVLDRLKAQNVRLYRTDLQGDITITTRGRDDFDVKAERQPKEEMWSGRKPQKDDSARSGFIAYGDFGPAPRNRNENNSNANGNNRNSNNRNSRR
ncbi:MAG TPA: ComEC/Rec2 family competence protein [Pyrinomonadaceae bacterium]|nr:ComEC/Rec2 family competence protein [Pyrinomonadaceae bacterium]